MACIKCGNKADEGQLFCSRCVEIMEAYPVKPDVHIQLPPRRSNPAAMKAGRKRRAPSPEELVAVLRKRQIWLLSTIAVLLVLVVLGGFLGAKLLRESHADEKSEWGRNYTLDDTRD